MEENDNVKLYKMLMKKLDKISNVKQSTDTIHDVLGLSYLSIIDNLLDDNLSLKNLMIGKKSSNKIFADYYLSIGDFDLNEYEKHNDYDIDLEKLNDDAKILIIFDEFAQCIWSCKSIDENHRNKCNNLCLKFFRYLHLSADDYKLQYYYDDIKKEKHDINKALNEWIWKPENMDKWLDWRL